MLPVEASAFKINEMIDLLRKEMNEQLKNEVHLSNQNDSIKSRVTVFGVVSVTIMVISTYMQV